MFIYRLKHEFRENWVMVVLWTLALVALVFALHRWWLDFPLESSNTMGAMTGLFVMALYGIGAVLTCQCFKRDDLKSPVAFWATRPVRPRVIFCAKWVFLQLVIALPLGICVFVGQVLIDGNDGAFANAGETILWAMGATTFLAASNIAVVGGKKRLLAAFAFIGGIILVAFSISTDSLEPLLSRFAVDPEVVSWNLLIAGAIVTIWLIWRCMMMVCYRHRKERLLSYFIVGVLTACFIPFFPLPTYRSPAEIPSTIGGSNGTDPVGWTSTSQGNVGGVPYIGFYYTLPLPEGLGNAARLADTRLSVVGKRAETIEIRSNGFRHAWSENGKLEQLSASLELRVFKNQVGSRNSSSSGSFADNSPLKEMKHVKLRIEGEILIEAREYEAFYQGSIDKGFHFEGARLKAAYVPAASHGMPQDEGELITKYFQWPLVTSSDASLHSGRINLRIDHPLGNVSSLNNSIENGGSSNRSGLFGGRSTRGYQITEKSITRSSYWRDLERDHPDLTYEAWKKNATLIAERAARKGWIKIPVAVEIEVPNPALVVEMMRGKRD